MKKALHVITLSKRIILYILLGFILILLLTLFNAQQNSLLTWGRTVFNGKETKAQIAIIIDDFGNNQN